MQGIYAVALSLEDVPDLMVEDPVEAAARIDRAIDRLNLAIRDLRNFIQGLGSEVTADSGLVVGLATLADELRLNTLVDVDVDLGEADVVADTLGRAATDQLLHIAREALSNVARHSAASRAAVSLRRQVDEAVLTVTDNGRGFDPTATVEGGHYGLANLRERASSLGGRLIIESEPDAGTRVIARLPFVVKETPQS
jgi:signal transduction histidine kinase